jgi:MFS family permease
LVSSVLFSIGGAVTSQAPSLKVFLMGRVISGIGGAGIMTISLILVLELSRKKRRGLFIGLVNTGFTTGVALGAVVAGALLPVTGWVCDHLPSILDWGETDETIETLILVPSSPSLTIRPRSLLQHP